LQHAGLHSAARHHLQQAATCIFIRLLMGES
jgi:hypothetical protein